MSDADTVLQIAPLPPPTPTPAEGNHGEQRLYAFLAAESARRDAIESERRRDEAARRVQYEAERQEQARAMTAQAQQLAQVVEFVTALTDRVADLAGTLDHLRGEMLAVQAKQAGVASKLDTLTLRLDAALTELGRVGGRVDDQASDLHALRQRLDALEAEVGEIKRRLDDYAPPTRPPATDPTASVEPLEPDGQS